MALGLRISYMVSTRETEQGARPVHHDLDGSASAVALWMTGPGVGELRREELAAPRDGEVLVRATWTGVSRGTESLVARGEVPASEHERMRAPFQRGAFPFPVAYGYLAVGVVEQGPAHLRGRTVFALHPHRSAFVVPVDAVHPVPDGVPARRALLAGAVETAVNVLWDAAPALGDRVLVVGGGMIGCAIARLAAGIPGVEVVLVDADPAVARLAAALGVGFAAPDDAPVDRDVVIEASGAAGGLQLALRVVATDGEVVVASWFGSRPVPLELGADFHSRRLTIRSSQVGAVASRRRERRTQGDRLALALRLLDDPAWDVLLADPVPWRRLPTVVAELARSTEPVSGEGPCPTIDWSIP